jgi:hypothetical protein
MKTTSRARSVNIHFVLIFTEEFSLGLEAISFQPAAIFLSFRAKLTGSVTGQLYPMLSLLNKQNG